MPNSGTATRTHKASVTVVESDPVGGSKPGMTVPRLDRAMNRNSVPRNPRYFRGFRSPTSLIIFTTPVTIISSKFCQRERVDSAVSLRVMTFAPTTITSISAHVKTRVVLSLWRVSHREPLPIRECRQQ